MSLDGFGSWGSGAAPYAGGMSRADDPGRDPGANPADAEGHDGVGDVEATSTRRTEGGVASATAVPSGRRRVSSRSSGAGNSGLVFDDPLDRPASDDSDRGWGDTASAGDDDFTRFLNEKPPHHL